MPTTDHETREDDPRVWFHTFSNFWYHHADRGDGTALCRKTIRPYDDHRATRGDMNRPWTGNRIACDRCAVKLAELIASREVPDVEVSSGAADTEVCSDAVTPGYSVDSNPTMITLLPIGSWFSTFPDGRAPDRLAEFIGGRDVIDPDTGESVLMAVYINALDYRDEIRADFPIYRLNPIAKGTDMTDTTTFLTRDQELVKVGDTVWTRDLPETGNAITSGVIVSAEFAPPGGALAEYQYRLTLRYDNADGETMYGTLPQTQVNANRESVDDTDWN